MLNSCETAIVTGASSGIGLAYCHQLASMGINLILVARSQDRLNALAETLIKKHDVRVHVLPLDLMQSDAITQIRKQVDQLNVSVDIIINNAGFDDLGDFLTTPWSDHQSMFQAMLLFPTQLCYEFLPAMQKKKSGYIINVGSIVGLFTLKGFKRSGFRVLYAPIKSYIIDFTCALARRYKADGIQFQALCPGLTYSEFHKRSGELDIYTRVPKFFWLSSEEVARQSLTALKKNKTIVVTGWINRLLYQIHRRLLK